MKNRQRGHQINHVTATFILLVNRFWEVKDDLGFSRRRGSKDNEEEAEGGRRKGVGRDRRSGEVRERAQEGGNALTGRGVSNGQLPVTL